MPVILIFSICSLTLFQSSSSVMSVPTFDQSPLELPGKDCLKPEMRLEYLRIVSFALLLPSNVPSGVFVLNLAKNLYFFTRNSRIICFYCGFHYVLGHSETCRGNWCNVPFNKCWDLMEQERRCCEAVEESIQLGRMTLIVSVAAHRPQFGAQFHPDDAGRRTSADMPVSRFRSQDQSLVAAGFYPGEF